MEQKVCKLQVYKDRVAFYEDLAKLKEDWKQALTDKKDMLLKYLRDQVEVVGATCQEVEENQDEVLAKKDFEYVIVSRAQQIPGLELLIPMIRGKKVILIGDATSQGVSLFARLYERCPKENKSLLETLI